MPDIQRKTILGVGGERLEIPEVLPLLPVRDAVVFPGVTRPLAIGRPRSRISSVRWSAAGRFPIG